MGNGPNRNRLFTCLNSMVIFHGYVTHNQMVDDLRIIPHSSRFHILSGLAIMEYTHGISIGIGLLMGRN